MKIYLCIGPRSHGILLWFSLILLLFSNNVLPQQQLFLLHASEPVKSQFLRDFFMLINNFKLIRERFHL